MNLRAAGAAAAVPEAARESFRSKSSAAWLRLVATLLWPPAMVAAIYLAIGRLGFFPSDEGLTLADSYRILHGQFPHRDFVSVRPVGSPLLHVVDFAIPGPLFEVSRVISVCEYVAYSALFAWLIFQLAPWRWSAAMILMTAAAVLVNLNRFPLMAWYTADGLLLIAVGLVLVATGVRRDSWGMIAAGFVILGCAGLTKQSFVPAPGLGWLMLWPRLQPVSWSRRVREVVMTAAYGAAPYVAYLAPAAYFAGERTLRSQLLGAPLIYGQPLLNPWAPGRDFIALALVVAAGALMAARARAGESRFGVPMAIAWTAVVIGVALSGRLGLQSDMWSIRLFWMAIAYWVVATTTTRSIDFVGLAVIGTAWMASLSYSFFYPSLMGGSLALWLIHRGWVGISFPSRGMARRAAPATGAVLALALTAVTFYGTRTQDVYVDRPASELTAGLSGISPTFGGIQTNPLTARYLEQMVWCIKRYPARRVAILPENAAMYPALNLDNPFPLDWIWTYDSNGSEGRIRATADALNREGDYLVLFQTVDEGQIVGAKSLPDATLASPIQAFLPLPAEIYAKLNGQKTTCGSFLVVYSPPPSA